MPIEFEAEHIRRKGDDLYAQITVRCRLHGARTYGGLLTVSTENISSAYTRARFASILSKQSQAPQIDWTRLVDEFGIRLLQAEATGHPSVLLSETPDRADDGYYDVLGVKLPMFGTAGIYAKGDSAKSLFGLYALGELANRGVPVAFLDYEWDPSPHKRRQALLWPDGHRPPIRYIQCTRPLVQEADSIRRDFLAHGIRYFAIDSIAPACHDKPEFSDTAISFNRAARYVAGTQAGQLWLGHVVKNGQPGSEGEETFFGSVFWGNLIRCGWFVKAQSSGDGQPLICAFHHRKRNGLPQLPSVGISIQFEADRIRVNRCDLDDRAPDLAAGQPLWQRMVAGLRQGPRSVEDLAEELGAKPDAIKKAGQRGTRLFTKLEGGYGVPARLALVERRPTS
ncbi:MAG: hypothetical protein ABI818_10315 [Acidobacteriota bacterium]